MIGQLVTPQKSEVIPTAVQSVGEKPIIWPKRHPNAAPIQNDGTISPPLYPAPSVTAVKIIFKINASGRTEESIHFSIIPMPVPLYVWSPTKRVSAITMHPPVKARRYLFVIYFLYNPSKVCRHIQKRILTNAHKTARIDIFTAEIMPKDGILLMTKKSFVTLNEAAMPCATRELMTHGTSAI